MPEGLINPYFPTYGYKWISNISATRAFGLCCKVGYIEGLDRLAVSPWANIDAGLNNSEVLRLACERGNMATVKYLYTHYRNELSISAMDNYALIMSCRNGHTETVRFLIDNWVTEEAVTGQDCKAFRVSCEHKRYDTAKLLLDRYQSVIESCDAVFTDDITFRHICRFEWKDLIQRLMPAFRLALNRLPIGSMDDAFGSLCIEPLEVVRELINIAASPELHRHLVNTALTCSYIFKKYERVEVITKEFESEVDPETINTIFGCRGSYINDYWELHRWALRDLLRYLSTKYRDTITIETYGRALGYAVSEPRVSRRLGLISLFTDDLHDKITPEACIDALETAGHDYYLGRARFGAMGKQIYHILIKKFGDKLDRPASNKIFKKACCWEEWRAITVCLNHLGPKLDLSVMPTNLLHRCLIQEPEIAATVLTAFNSRMDAPAVNAFVQEYWNICTRTQTLIQCFRDKIDGRALIHTTLERATSNSERVKLIVTEFDADIDHTTTAKLLNLPGSVLYYLLSPDAVKELIDAYQHEEVVKAAVATLDPSHEHYEYILLDYRPKRIKAATS